MTRPPDRIHLEPNTSEATRLHIKERVFSELARTPVPTQIIVLPTPRWKLSLAFAGAIAATAVITWLVVREDEQRVAVDSPSSEITQPVPAQPSPALSAPEPAPEPAPAPPEPATTRISVPEGETRRVEVGDAIIDASSSTVAEVKRDDDGSMRVSLASGGVRCEVPPRPSRPRFEVEAAGVLVVVRGTIFSVQREGSDVAVSVERGKVVVRSDSGDAVVRVGEHWSSRPENTVAHAKPSRRAPAARARPTREMYERAQSLEAKSPGQAAKAYREVADGRGRWAALALYSLAELEHRRRNYSAALRAIKQHQRRFRRNRHADDVAWLRVEVLKSSGKKRSARAAARAYLERFPNGTYAGLARRLAD